MPRWSAVRLRQPTAFFIQSTSVPSGRRSTPSVSLGLVQRVREARHGLERAVVQGDLAHAAGLVQAKRRQATDAEPESPRIPLEVDAIAEADLVSELKRVVQATGPAERLPDDIAPEHRADQSAACERGIDLDEVGEGRSRLIGERGAPSLKCDVGARYAAAAGFNLRAHRAKKACSPGVEVHRTTMRYLRGTWAWLPSPSTQSG